MKTNWSIRTLSKHARQFCGMQSTDDLCRLIKKEPFRVQLQVAQPAYNIFSIPKKDGSLRWIEDPQPALKEMQRSLNSFLQGVYFFNRTDAAYGFMVSARDDAAPRNIVTNAQCHLDRPYLLNIDLEDFFHQVKTEKVFRVFAAAPFHFNDELSDMLARLTTHQGRLPMGAPTSPVLSNFATIQLDHDLLRLARTKNFIYTRYADDLAFSSAYPIPTPEENDIREVIKAHHFTINEEKVKHYGKDDTRLITGLKVTGKKVALPDDYLPVVEKEIEKLKNVMEVNERFKTLQSNKQLNVLQQMIRGHVNFAGMVLGEKHFLVQQLLDKLEDAIHPPSEFESASWLEFDYL